MLGALHSFAIHLSNHLTHWRKTQSASSCVWKASQTEKRERGNNDTNFKQRQGSKEEIAWQSSRKGKMPKGAEAEAAAAAVSDVEEEEASPAHDSSGSSDADSDEEDMLKLQDQLQVSKLVGTSVEVLCNVV